MRSRSKIVASCLTLSLCGCSLHAQTFLGVQLGEDTLQTILKKLGPARTIFLAQDDGNQAGSVDGWMGLQYELAFPTAEDRPVLVEFSIEPRTLIAPAASVKFQGVDRGAPLLPVADLASVMRGERRVIHHHLVELEGGLDYEMSDCDDPNGEYETWLYAESGAQVSPVIKNGQVLGIRYIRFSTTIASGQEAFPPCDQAPEQGAVRPR